MYFQACSAYPVQHILCTQVSDSGPVVLWLLNNLQIIIKVTSHSSIKLCLLKKSQVYVKTGFLVTGLICCWYLCLCVWWGVVFWFQVAFHSMSPSKTLFVLTPYLGNELMGFDQFLLMH